MQKITLFRNGVQEVVGWDLLSFTNFFNNKQDLRKFLDYL
jgi:hypothetical protein